MSKFCTFVLVAVVVLSNNSQVVAQETNLARIDKVLADAEVASREAAEALDRAEAILARMDAGLVEMTVRLSKAEQRMNPSLPIYASDAFAADCLVLSIAFALVFMAMWTAAMMLKDNDKEQAARRRSRRLVRREVIRRRRQDNDAKQDELEKVARFANN